MADSRPIAYLATTFVSYLTSRPSRDLVMAAHQEVTREWWAERRSAYHLITSQLVLSEASAGDPDAAKRRLEVLQHVELVEITAEARELARALLAAHVVPSRAAEDALHIAIAAESGASYLITWNCKHIAHAAMRGSIEDVCRSAGVEPPALCTPLELLEELDDDT
jgi:predicted nucleic acid-binding protein